jgi:hypothetical protein
LCRHSAALATCEYDVIEILSSRKLLRPLDILKEYYAVKPNIVLFAFVAAIVAASPISAAPLARSGQYDSLTVAVVDGAVSGTFYDARGLGPGGGPQFTCIFMLRGKLDGDRAKIDTWAPGEKEHIAGELIFEKHGAKIKLTEDHGGCLATDGDMVHQFYKAIFEKEGTGWLGVAMVAAEQASFRPAPRARAPRKPYVIRYDPLVILARKGNWLRVSYLFGSKPVTGWMRRKELFIVGPVTGR